MPSIVTFIDTKIITIAILVQEILTFKFNTNFDLDLYKHWPNHEDHDFTIALLSS